MDSEQLLWSDERCLDAEQSMEWLLVVQMVLVDCVGALHAVLHCVGTVGMGGGDGHIHSALMILKLGELRGGGEAIFEQYYVVGREPGVAAAL